MQYRTDIVYNFDAQNESRADLAEWSIAVGSDREGEEHPELVEQDTADAVANIIHFCARAGLDWDAVVRRAESAARGDLEDGPEAVRDAERFPEAD